MGNRGEREKSEASWASSIANRSFRRWLDFYHDSIKRSHAAPSRLPDHETPFYPFLSYHFTVPWRIPPIYFNLFFTNSQIVIKWRNLFHIFNEKLLMVISFAFFGKKYDMNNFVNFRNFELSFAQKFIVLNFLYVRDINIKIGNLEINIRFNSTLK